MRTIKKSIFTFSELSEHSKEKARDWYRQDLPVDYDFVFEDAANVADILGLDIRQARKTTMAGIIHYVPAVYFSGFWSQGDGACFEGRYSYKKGWKKTLKAFYNDAELLRIGQALQDLQKSHFYRLSADIKHSGRYYHEYSMTVDCAHFDNPYLDTSSIESEFKDIFADFAKWIYKNLEAEYEHASSNDAVDEALELGEFEFYENGDVFLGSRG